jgi:hypothetical protein
VDRDAFREAVFVRDNNRCVICGCSENLAAHHIIERKMFPDGGYVPDNGATLCERHHLEAEACILTCEEIRDKAGISRVVVPPRWIGTACEKERISKWGDILDHNGNIIVEGPLFRSEQWNKAWLLRYSLKKRS